MDGDGTNWLTGIGFALLTCNSALAIYQSKEDTCSVAFVVSVYFSLLLLFWFLRLYEQAGQNAAQRGRQKAAIWMLSTYLTSIFSYKVAALMPWPIALVVWGMGATVASGGFYAFFIYHA
jgi:Family of unknown function (DUF6490)